LNEGYVVTVDYTKQDGTSRKIVATKVDPLDSGDDNHLTVWDDKKKDWRTLIINKINSVNAV